jgi:HAD superfamily hydrolase (TIGR01509 family)
MPIDPKTALRECETLMLDMDGTILDLAFDNYVWKELVPERYAASSGLAFEVAREELFAKYEAILGDLEWYCLDHWSERLGFDVLELHREVRHRIGYLPAAREFLEAVHSADVRVLLVTNSHADTLRLKDDTLRFSRYFDGVYSSHALGYAKERREFWQALAAAEGFDPGTTLFVDDTERVLQSAADFGIASLITITRPDTTAPPRGNGLFAGIEGVCDLLG